MRGARTMRLGILMLFVMMACGRCLAGRDSVTSWPDLIQKPHEHLPTPDLGLKPLLWTPDDQNITTKEAWEKQRPSLRTTWLNGLENSGDSSIMRVRLRGEPGHSSSQKALELGNPTEGQPWPIAGYG